MMTMLNFEVIVVVINLGVNGFSYSESYSGRFSMNT